jgi:hypothetical protein
MPRSHHILNAASNLLGISLIIITGLHLTSRAQPTFADEIAWLAAACFSVSCLFSYIGIRREPEESRFGRWADPVFLSGVGALVVSVFVLAATKL